MTMDLAIAAERLFWYGTASAGFGILFNVPVRTLPVIWLMGAVCGGVRLGITITTGQAVLASFAGATLAGVLCIWAAHTRHAPPMVFAIPAVIPMVPGTFAYRMMIGVFQLAGDPADPDYGPLLHETVNNGLKTFLILTAISVGVSLPMLIMRKDSVKDARLTRGGNDG